VTVEAPEFEADLPYVVSIIELDAGPRIVSNISCDVNNISIGQPVEAAFEHISNDITLLKFKLPSHSNQE
jgi:uncharacterized OB-fold protein